MQRRKLFCVICALLISVTPIVGQETTPVDVTDFINEDVTVHDRELTAIPSEIEFTSVRTDVDKSEDTEKLIRTTLSEDPESLTELAEASTVLPENNYHLLSVEADFSEESLADGADVIVEDQLFRIVEQDDQQEPDGDLGSADHVYEGELQIEARRIDPPHRSVQRLPRPGMKVEKNKYQAVQSVSSEEDEDQKTVQEVKVTNMRIIGVSKDKVEEEPMSISLQKPPPKPIVHEKVLVYKQKPVKKVDPKSDRKKIPYAKPIKLAIADEDSSQEDVSVSTLEYSNMRIMGVPKDDPVSEGPDLYTSETAHTKLPIKSLVVAHVKDENSNQNSAQESTLSGIQDPVDTLESDDELSPVVVPVSKSTSVDEVSSPAATTPVSQESILNRIQELVQSQKNSFAKEASDDDKYSNSFAEDVIESSGDDGRLESDNDKLEGDVELPLTDGSVEFTQAKIVNVNSSSNISQLLEDDVDFFYYNKTTPITTAISTSTPSHGVAESTTQGRVTYPRPKFSRKPYLRLTTPTTTTTEKTEDGTSTSKKPIKRFSTSHLNFTRSSTIHRRTQIFSPPSSQSINDILPLENFWDDDTIQKWKNIHQIYADYGKRELKLRVLKDAKRLRHSVGDILHDFTSLAFPINKERICRVRKVQIIIIVFSRAENFAVRDSIRKTWVKDLNVTESDEVKYLFFLPESSLFKEEVLIEQKNYGDLIQTDASEKDMSLSFLKWISDYCPRALMVLKVDDRVFVNVDNFFNSLKRITDMNAMYGIRATHLVTERGRNGLDESSWPWKTLPPYLDSSILLIGGEAVPKLYGAAQTLPRLNHEGLYLTSLCAQQAGVKRYLFKRFFSEQRDFNITNCAVEYLDAFGVSSPDRFEPIYEDVKKVKFESQKCFGTIDCVENLFGVCVSLHEIL